MANYSLILMVVVMLSINIGLGLYDSAVASYNPLANSTIAFNSSPASQFFSDSDLSGSLQTDKTLALPDSSDSVDTETGNIFTDTWKSIKNWFSDVDEKLGVIGGMMNQPMNFLKDIGVPPIFANSFGALWYIMIIFLSVSALRGGGVS